MCMLSRVWLCDLMDHGPPGSSIHWILLARILDWVAIPSPRRSSWTRDRNSVSCIFCIGRQNFLPLGITSSVNYVCRPIIKEFVSNLTFLHAVFQEVPWPLMIAARTKVQLVKCRLWKACCIGNLYLCLLL